MFMFVPCFDTIQPTNKDFIIFNVFRIRMRSGATKKKKHMQIEVNEFCIKMLLNRISNG